MQKIQWASHDFHLDCICSAAVVVVHNLFVERHSGQHAENLETWNHILLRFLAKFLGATDLSDFRGIALISCFAKLYMTCLMMLFRKYRLPQMQRELQQKTMCFGFEAGHQVDHISFIITDLMSKTHAWGDGHHISVFGGDIISAFDFLTLQAVDGSCDFWKLHPRLAAALVNELQHEDWPSLDGLFGQGPLMDACSCCVAELGIWSSNPRL